MRLAISRSGTPNKAWAPSGVRAMVMAQERPAGSVRVLGVSRRPVTGVGWEVAGHREEVDARGDRAERGDAPGQRLRVGVVDGRVGEDAAGQRRVRVGVDESVQPGDFPAGDDDRPARHRATLLSSKTPAGPFP
ncbi:hypothetical protein GCM10023148_32260 [Actinokineospora soli]